MTERPIIFSAPMVRAILAGNKTQTRRIVRPVGNDEGFVIQEQKDGAIWPYRSDDGESSFYTERRGGREYLCEAPHACLYGQPSDRLWVRETWQPQPGSGRPIYRADDIAGHIEGPWRSPIHMPRSLSRITLEVTAVRVERLQDISEEDALAEGVFRKVGTTPIGDVVDTVNDGQLIYAVPTQARFEYSILWASLHGRDSWASNPWVWVLTFKSRDKS